LLCLTSYHHFASTKQTSLLADIAGNRAFECCRLYCRDLDLDIKHDCHKSSNQTLTITINVYVAQNDFDLSTFLWKRIQFHFIEFHSSYMILHMMKQWLDCFSNGNSWLNNKMNTFLDKLANLIAAKFNWICLNNCCTEAMKNLIHLSTFIWWVGFTLNQT